MYISNRKNNKNINLSSKIIISKKINDDLIPIAFKDKEKYLKQYIIPQFHSTIKSRLISEKSILIDNYLINNEKNIFISSI